MSAYHLLTLRYMHRANLQRSNVVHLGPTLGIRTAEGKERQRRRGREVADGEETNA